MENHPIPQDVTGFKFKLIGSVTVKQFLYILGGGILAAVTFILPISVIIRLPFALLFGGVGAALAFLPIEGRPMDIMIKNFIKALPAENQYIFRKRGAEAIIAELFTPPVVTKKAVATLPTNSARDSKRELLYKTLKVSPSYQPDAKEQEVLTNINSYFNESSHSASPSQVNADAVPEKSPSLQIVKPPTSVTPKETITPTPAPAIKAVETTPPVAEKIEEMINVKPDPVPVQPIKTTKATPIKPDAQLKGGFPSLPDTPNIVMGIIKDPRGKVLPNILVEIMDMQNIPVRAFKTNALGQFAAATPLANGEYSIILDDPKKTNEFPPIKISLTGDIFQPIEIVSVDQREKLRRELFGQGALPAQQQ
jgi:hypothetical protein